jgi:hypothetical protein
MSDPARPPDPPRPGGPLWFLAVPDEFRRRFILRTLLQPPPSIRLRPPRLRPPAR